MKNTYQVEGMHCKSCEILIEETLEGIKGIKKADVNLSKNELVIESKKEISNKKLNSLFEKNGYRFGDLKATLSTPLKKEGISWLIPTIGIIILFILLNKLGLASFLKINSQSSLITIFIFGIVAGFSSCGALLSGIIVTYKKQRWQLLLGRIFGYTLAGGLLGLLGQKIAIGALTNILLIVVSTVMIIVALQMMGWSPAQKIKLNLPKSWSKNIGDKKLPLIIGVLTVLLPCGFTLLVEGLAVLSGSFLSGLILMLVFVLGSSIPLWLIGLSSEKMIKNQKAMGLLVLFFVGYNLYLQFNLKPTLPSLNPPSFKTTEGQRKGGQETQEVKQIIKASYTNLGLSPYQITVKKGEKVRLEIEVLVSEYGCMNTILLPELFEKPQTLTKGKTLVMEFTPTKTGVYQFVCAMGVPHKGEINVVE
jgi:sulfite exporter TauE/SafE/copper chaperone CopZ/plastocyanin